MPDYIDMYLNRYRELANSGLIWKFYLHKTRFKRASNLVIFIDVAQSNDGKAAIYITFDFTPPPGRSVLNWGVLFDTTRNVVTMIDQVGKPRVFIGDATLSEDRKLLDHLIPDDQDKKTVSLMVDALVAESLRLAGFPDHIIRGPMTDAKLSMPRYIAVTEEFKRLGYHTWFDKVHDNTTYIHHRRNPAVVQADFTVESDEGLLHLSEMRENSEFFLKHEARLRQESLERIKKAMEPIQTIFSDEGYTIKNIKTGDIIAVRKKVRLACDISLGTEGVRHD